MSDIDFDTAKLLMDVIEAASRHGVAAGNIRSEAMRTLAEIEAEASEIIQARAKAKADEEAERAAAEAHAAAPDDEENEQVQHTGRRM